VDKNAYLVARFGAERLKLLHDRIGQIGRENGINFAFQGRIGNTRASHRLIQLGKTKSPAVQTRVVEELFKSYFEESGDITSHAMLTAAGVKAGLEEKEVRAWLESEQGGEEVDREVDEARELGINGVPNFTLQAKYQVGGAQDEDVFLGLWAKIKSMEAKKADVGIKVEQQEQVSC
jgi:predicted DsbA family dithiol-disulfide isomerase